MQKQTKRQSTKHYLLLRHPRVTSAYTPRWLKVTIAPDAATDQAATLRVVSDAAADVAASPGSAVCNFTYTFVGMVHADLPVV